MSHAAEIRAARDAAVNAYVEGLLSELVEQVAELVDEIEGWQEDGSALQSALDEAATKIAALEDRIAELEAELVEPEPEADFGPTRSFPATEQGVAAAMEFYGIADDINPVIIRATETRPLEQIHAQGGANDVFFFEGREEPYWYDVSAGPMAPSVASYDGVDANGKIDRVNRVPITNPGKRSWFGFTRTRRGIVGLDPSVVIAPSGTLVRPPHPVLQEQTHLTAAERYQYWYGTDGTTRRVINGCPTKLIECETANSVFAGFTLRGPENHFGGMQYTGLSIMGDGQHLLKRVRFEDCWHSGEGVPNTESGGVTLSRVDSYVIENCDFAPSGPTTSSIMTNNVKDGGALRKTRIPKVTNGMMTHWRASGLHIMEDIDLDGGFRSFNLEELRPGFELQWTGGSLRVDRGRHHFGINPVAADDKTPAPPRISLVDVEVSQDAWAFVNGGRLGLDMNVYQGSPSDPICAKASWITHTVDGEVQAVHCVPESRWID